MDREILRDNKRKLNGKNSTANEALRRQENRDMVAMGKNIAGCTLFAEIRNKQKWWVDVS